MKKAVRLDRRWDRDGAVVTSTPSPGGDHQQLRDLKTCDHDISGAGAAIPITGTGIVTADTLQLSGQTTDTGARCSLLSSALQRK
jgi:hypothetical protein